MESSIPVWTHLNAASAKRMAHWLRRLADRGVRQCIIDMSSIESIDSPAFGAIIAAARRFKQMGGSVVVVCSQSTLRRLFEITGLARVMPIVDRPEMASAILAGATQAA